MLKYFKIFSVGLVVQAILLHACGGGKFSGASKRDSASSGPTTEQPTEVAGGFGLTCIPSDNPSDATKTDYACTFKDQNGNKFNERSDIKLTVAVNIGDIIIDVVMQASTAASNFTFTVAKADVDKVAIAAKFVDPMDPAKVLADKSTNLSVVVSTGKSTGKCNLDTSQPSYVTASPGDSQVMLGLKPNVADPAIDGYIVRYWQDTEYDDNGKPKLPSGAQGIGTPLDWFNQGEPVSDATATITGLVNGKPYTFGIIAHEPNRCGYSREFYIVATPTGP